MGNLRLAVVAIAVIVTSTPALAQKNRKPEAEALFKQGKAEMAKGNFASACPMFQSSYDLDARASTLMNLGACHEAAGKLFSAWYAFVEAAKLADRSTDEQALGPPSKQRADALEPRLSSLRVVVAPDVAVDGLEILRNGAPILDGQWNHDSFLDGGEYTIVARAPERTEWTTTVTIAKEGDKSVLTVPALALAPTPAPGATADIPALSTTAPAVDTAKMVPAPRPSRAKKLAFGVWSGGRNLNIDVDGMGSTGPRYYSGGFGLSSSLFAQYWVTHGFALRAELGVARLSTTDQNDSTISATFLGGAAIVEYTFGAAIVQPSILAGVTLTSVSGDVTNFGSGNESLGSTIPGKMGGLALRIAPAQLRKLQFEIGVRYWDGSGGSLSGTLHTSKMSGFMFHAGVSTGAGR